MVCGYPDRQLFRLFSIMPKLLHCVLYIEGSFGFHMTRVNCTQAYQPSGAFSFSSRPCSRYIETWSTLLPRGNSNTRLHVQSASWCSLCAASRKQPYHGCPPHSNLGPRCLWLNCLYSVIFHVKTSSYSISKSACDICIRAFMPSTANYPKSASLT